MRGVLGLLICAALAACDSGYQSLKRPINGSIAHDLQRGMTEQQLSEVSSGRVPNRIIISTCGTETANPFPCKVYVYERGLRAGQYDRKLSVVLEDFGGQWKVSQWL
jgi:hypothetical protein